MDYLRAGYKTKIKPFFDSEILIDIVWFFAASGAKVFPGQHNFSSLLWDDPRIEGEIGERKRGFRFSNGKLPFPIGFEGQKFCGPKKFFVNGASINDAPLSRALNAVPICCIDPKGVEGGDGLALGTDEVDGWQGWEDLGYRFWTGRESVFDPDPGFRPRCTGDPNVVQLFTPPVAPLVVDWSQGPGDWNYGYSDSQWVLVDADPNPGHPVHCGGVPWPPEWEDGAVDCTILLNNIGLEELNHVFCWILTSEPQDGLAITADGVRFTAAGGTSSTDWTPVFLTEGYWPQGALGLTVRFYPSVGKRFGFRIGLFPTPSIIVDGLALGGTNEYHPHFILDGLALGGEAELIDIFDGLALGETVTDTETQIYDGLALGGEPELTDIYDGLALGGESEITEIIDGLALGGETSDLEFIYDGLALGGVSQQLSIDEWTAFGDYTWTCPNNAVEVYALAVGPGGGGADGNFGAGLSGGGGGAGGYGSGYVVVTGGETYNLRVGQGGPSGAEHTTSWFDATNVIQGDFGIDAVDGNGTSGGNNNVGPALTSQGGDGGDGNLLGGGGGGGGAAWANNPGGDGGDGTAQAGGAGGTAVGEAGAGGDGGSITGGNGQAGFYAGGGGGGGGVDLFNFGTGGAGQDGLVRLIYYLVD